MPNKRDSAPCVAASTSTSVAFVKNPSVVALKTVRSDGSEFMISPNVALTKEVGAGLDSVTVS